MHRTRLLIAALALLAIGLAQGETLAHDRVLQGCPMGFPDKYVHYSPGGRVHEEDIDGSRVLVMLPPAYESSGRRYPVVWLFHGGLNTEDCYLLETNLLSFTQGLPDHMQAIVVMPDGRPTAHWVDARDGSLKDETRFLDKFIPAIDNTYRTIPNGRHRAIAGFSSGGLGAMHLAARYPDRFAAAASVSGWVILNETDPFGLVAVGALQYPYPFLVGSAGGPEGIWGNPLTDTIWWRDFDPMTLARNYGGTSVSLFSGNGIPCDLVTDLPYIINMPFFAELEPEVRRQNVRLSGALDRAGVQHVRDTDQCGLHTYLTVQRELHSWWPTLFDAFGSPKPASFDHRRAVPTFAVWGWTFEADATRAAEFLDVTDASCDGLTLTGSGRTRVTSASCFVPGSTLLLDGAVEASAKANAAGQISFTVDLGPAHTMQQYTIEQRATEALGGYWTTRTVGIG